MKIRILLLAFLSFYLFSCSDDDDVVTEDPIFTVTATQTNVSEDGGVVSFTFTLPEATQLDVYTYELSGSASSEDYQIPTTLSFTVPEGGNSAVVTFNVINDDEVEGIETVILEITERNGISLSIGDTNPATVTIDDDDSFPFENGFLITNQGPFGSGFGAVSFLDAGFSVVQNDIYQTVNNDNLGNIVNSIGFTEDQAYVIANVSNRITVVDRFTFEEQARIDTGLNNPRHFVAIGDKGYVTNWGDGSNPDDDYIAVINLLTNAIVATIPVGEGPERLVASDDNVYVAHQGGFSVNNIISVIDSTIDQVSTTIEVGDVPNSIELDGQGNLWVLGAGSPSFTGNETGGTLSVIDLQEEEVVQTETFAVTEHPSALNIENGSLYYYLSGGVYTTELVEGFTLPTQPILDGLSFFNMRVIDDSILGLDAVDFNSNGSLEVYDLDTLELSSSFELGIVPDQIYIN